MPHSPEHMHKGVGEARDSHVQNVMDVYNVGEHEVNTSSVGFAARRGQDVLSPSNIRKMATVSRFDGDTMFDDEGGSYALQEGTMTGPGANPNKFLGKTVNLKGRSFEVTGQDGKARRSVTGWDMA